jgi:hypothetical protein
MINAPTFEQFAIATNGIPAKIVAPDPRVFSLLKLWLRRESSRDRLKKAKGFGAI